MPVAAFMALLCLTSRWSRIQDLQGASTTVAAVGKPKATITSAGTTALADDLAASAQKSPILDLGTKDGILDNQVSVPP